MDCGSSEELPGIVRQTYTLSVSDLDDELGDWLGKHFEQLGCLLPGLEAEAGDQQVRQPGREAAQRLQRQQHQHRQPVEAVVDRGPSKGPAEWHNRQDRQLICFAWPNFFFFVMQ